MNNNANVFISDLGYVGGGPQEQEDLFWMIFKMS